MLGYAVEKEYLKISFRFTMLKNRIIVLNELVQKRYGLKNTES
jgi:hypothetical protein